MTDVRDKNIIVISAAKSGVAVARLLKERGANVFVTDSGNIPAENKDVLVKEKIGYEEGGHSEQCRIADFAVVSPGVPDEAPLVQYYINAGREVHSEIEIASWFS